MIYYRNKISKSIKKRNKITIKLAPRPLFAAKKPQFYPAPSFNSLFN